MVSATVHRTWKQRWLTLVVRIIGSLLSMIAPFIGLVTLPTVYGAGLGQHQETGLGKGINMLINVKKSDMPSPQINLVVFFTRPVPCAENPVNCNNNIKSYAPNDKFSCSSPIPQAQKSSSANLAWVSDGEECPYLNCNWSNTLEGCSTHTSETLFRQAPPELSALGDTYMIQPLDYTKQSTNDNTYGFSGCIYYANWPEFPLKNSMLITSESKIQLVSGTLPNGITPQTIQTSLASSKQTQATVKGTGWTP